VTGGTGQPLAGLGVWSIKQTSAGWLLTAVSAQLGIAASSPGAVALSTDHGRTWTPIPDTASFANSGRITVSVGESGDSIVYAIASNTTGYDQSDMFRSIDGGLNWTALRLAGKTPTNANCDQPHMDLLNGQAYYNQSLLVDPGDATRNTVNAGGNLSLAKTSDGGATFEIVGDWLPAVSARRRRPFPMSMQTTTPTPSSARATIPCWHSAPMAARSSPVTAAPPSTPRRIPASSPC